MKETILRIPNLNSEKVRVTAMKTVAKLEGVKSISVQGDRRDEMRVIGGVDAVEMTLLLRKKLCSVELISVSEIREENIAESNNSIIEQVQPSFYPYYYSSYPQYYLTH